MINLNISLYMKTSYKTDIHRRPHAYINDIKESGAIKFAGGNFIYACFLVLQTGLNAGSAIAFAIQSVLTAHTIKKQADATYKGDAFDAPYKVQGWGNVLTAAFIATAGVTSYIDEKTDINLPDSVENVILGSAQNESATSNHQNDENLWSRMIFPTLTFGAWGIAHFSFGAAVNRRRKLAKDNDSENIIQQDNVVKTSTKRAEIASGTADVTAIFKDKSLGEAGEMLQSPLALQNLNSLSGLPFFLTGFYKSIARSNDNGVDRFINGNIQKLPTRIRRMTHLEHQDITPVHYYAAGYTSTAAFSAVSALSDPVNASFAAASALWGLAYHDITRENIRPRESADAYAERLAEKNGSNRLHIK